ncbi:unnamed protein product [Rotaria magnacalcarata]|uniref:Coiled-coil domain-containing protein 43 n=1 Tax=Rotaria magnacalcarata TaxID=392030 RepID=A0A815A4B4_9BILA|nr:unnamed protein product [Rotaria magnacalcarata]CAF1508895.1 unnamed protein product [Rotaria magnacalcarata]CAF2126380.1 unnamed protein product [Rotaria magnacalcarata]CAF2221540.1 unnamed protein product [Rotaria magnacalcarata]CAF3831765.1 unnamed protein product [Rotaria magnacalcarata]
MAEASSSSFDEWIRSLLNELQSNDVDMSDFVQYLMGIVTSDSETDEEKQVAIAELLADLDLKHDHNIDNLSEQILNRWYQIQHNNDHNSNSDKSRTDDDAMNDALINAMNQMESAMKQKQNNDHDLNKANDDLASKKHKSQVLAKYSEVSDEESDNEDEHETNANNLFQNTNTQIIEDREKKSRELQHEAHKKQQEKNKIDSNNQKQKDEERKKKAQQRAQKQERRR